MEKEILTLEEAAELFGVSVKTFIKLLKEERVPARKIGREWRFSRKALIEWLSIGDSQSYSASEGDTKEYYNQIAPKWEEIRKNYYDESIKNHLLNLGILKKDKTVIDLGSGNGYISTAVAKHVKKVIAVDISKEMIKELKKNAKINGIKNIDTIESNSIDIPVEDEAVDMVCANMFLHHKDEPEFAIKEIKRVLKPDGIVFLSDFYEHRDMELKEKMHDIWLGFSSGKIKKWFSDCGFVDIEITTVRQNEKENAKTSKAKIFALTAVKKQ
ncbi:methyltransferase domain-containing protein [Herbivorax sp. ANBcel31]|uniref:methyltransferase domain-containing protein n=1 Tax=Herbivorax sp. ANBcel31 TaxID=3069754 RepID=UPI0027B102A5|nr:methyltransferase domain-containing protein [Herbivorax sp. ANBcel31]MDQ2085499.1 methyltransferase domain-containing protein [Herbivorax sp. ANBcel31]